MLSGYTREKASGSSGHTRCGPEQDCGVWMPRKHCKIWRRFPATDWKLCEGTARDNTADVEVVDYH